MRERWHSTWDELETVPGEFIDAGHQVLVTVLLMLARPSRQHPHP
jgi:hypothetical protein